MTPLLRLAFVVVKLQSTLATRVAEVLHTGLAPAWVLPCCPRSMVTATTLPAVLAALGR